VFPGGGSPAVVVVEAPGVTAPAVVRAGRASPCSASRSVRAKSAIGYVP
jgi:hypothetical protein